MKGLLTERSVTLNLFQGLCKALCVRVYALVKTGFWIMQKSEMLHPIGV